ncbi:DUF6144 family protein [Mangrovibacterium sp.]|uniref:DUF6144 family protein n=1 Tax=Mangrovibacterium sp. TaxID=1961364 RepID=UPI00356A4DC3
MVSVDKHTDEKLSCDLLKSCACAHYEQLEMDGVLQPFEGKVNGFCSFLEQQWGWKVKYNEGANTILADENKNYCVCPMMSHDNGLIYAALCCCSEGYAELMFSKVAGRPVEATILSSLHRGDDRCKYQIKL